MMYYLKNWRIAIDRFCLDEGEIFRGMRKIEGLISGGTRTVDMAECIGITGALCDGDGDYTSGVGDIEPVRIRHIERLRRHRKFIDAVHAATGQLTKIKETYVITTTKGTIFVRACDMHADMMVILSDLVDGVDCLERLRVKPVRALNL